MAANMAGPALAWVLFFPDRTGTDGRVIPGTSVASNFEAMGNAFAVALLLLTAIALWGCRATIRDTRQGFEAGGAVREDGFWAGFGPILADRNVQRVLVLIFLTVVGMVIVSSLQSYLYVHFISFSGVEKTIVHGSTMVAAALGAAVSPWLAQRFDKKRAIIYGSVIGIAGEAGLALFFLTGLLPHSGAVAVGVFILFQGLYWMASGIVLPVATAMIADIAELNRLRTGDIVEGSYSAIFSFSWRLGTSLALLTTGAVLSASGFDTSGGNPPAPDAIWRVAGLGFMIGAAFYVITILWVRGYALDRARYQELSGTKTA